MVNALLAATVSYPVVALLSVILVILVALAFLADVIVGLGERDDPAHDGARR